jgi:hypothetical protein
VFSFFLASDSDVAVPVVGDLEVSADGLAEAPLHADESSSSDNSTDTVDQGSILQNSISAQNLWDIFILTF